MTFVVEKLRCTNCGAPLPQLKQGESFVKCEYCGFINRIYDSASYIEQLKREISKWISQILPQHTTLSTIADPVARHHLFQGYVKPRLIPISVSAKTTYVETIYKPFIVFNLVYSQTCKEPKPLFEESVKIESLSELAISDEDRLFINDTYRYLTVSAYICNALIDANKEKYTESVKNIDEALHLLETTEDKTLISRLKIAKATYTALSELYNRNTPASYSLIATALSQINELLNTEEVSKSKYQGALEIERDLINLIKNIIEISNIYFENGLDPLTPFPAINKTLTYTTRSIKDHNRPLKDAVEVINQCKRTILARFRREKVKILGDGNVYLPFYVVGTNITYTSGLLFKKGHGTRIDLLISAAFPTLPVISDVFGLYTGRLVNLEKEADKLRSISNLLENARNDYLGKNTILPLISHAIAESTIDKYLEYIGARYRGKIKLSTTQAREEIIYVGCILDNGDLKLSIPLTTLSSIDYNIVKEIMV
ncbi:MAG: hypothetical protein QXU08_09145 [Ignisphaera sp.]